MQARSVFVVQHEAKPMPGSEAFASCTGAYANVWVDATSANDALRIAVSEIEAAGWVVEGAPDVSLVTSSDYAADDAGLEHFEQALLDGVVLVFHTWHETH